MSRIKNLKFISKEQIKITEGLEQLSEEMLGFYQDALLILRQDCHLSSKVNLVAHLTREIDSGFRKIFAPKPLFSQMKEAKAGRGHYASILMAMGFENKNLADEWFTVATEFPSYAHGHGLTVRTLKDFQDLWERYEKILVFLVGSQYAFTDRINQLTQILVPTDEMLESLQYLMKDIKKEFLFYRNLRQPGWLVPLYEKGFFSIEKYLNDPPEQGNYNLPEWLPLRYFVNIADTVDETGEKVVTAVLEKFQNALIKGVLFLDEYAIYLFCKIIAALPDYSFNERDAIMLQIFCTYWPVRHKMYDSVLTEELLLKYTASANQQGIINLLTYCFGYTRKETTIEGFLDGEDLHHVIFETNIGDTYQWMISQNMEDVIKVGGLPLLEVLTRLLEKLANERPYEVNNIPSIEPSNQRSGIMDDWSYSLIDFISKGGEMIASEQLLVLLDLFSQKTSPIFKRITIHLIRLHFKNLHDRFWAYVNENPLDGDLPIHELYLLIREYSPSFSDEEFNNILTWITGLKFTNIHLEGEELERNRIYRIRKYLSSVTPANEAQNEKLKVLQTEFEDRSPYSLEHPEFDSYMTSSIGYDIPDNAMEMETKTVKEIVEELKQHKVKNDFDTTGSGLSLLLNNFIISDPHKYLTELEMILSLPPRFLKQVVGSLVTVLNNDHMPDWRKVLNALNARLLDGNFETESNLKDTRQTIAQFAEFLLKLSEKNQLLGLTEDDLNHLIAISIGILEKEIYKDSEHVENDLIGYLLSSVAGKLFESLANFGRIWTQRFSKDPIHRLNPQIIDYLDRNLSRTGEKEKGFSLGLGYNFWFFLYADTEWCDTHFQQIFPEADALHFDYTSRAMLSPYQSVFQSVVKYIRRHQLPARIVNRFHKESPELSAMCKLALLEYFEMDTLALTTPGTLLHKIVEKGNIQQLKRLVGICIELKPIQISEVLALFAALFAKYKADPQQLEALPKSLAFLVTLLPDFPDSTLELIYQILPFLDNDPSAYAVLRSLISRSGNNMEHVATMVLAVWKHCKVRVNVDQDLTQFIEGLYLKDLTELADELCVYVASTGEMGLKKVYDSNKLAEFGK